jgi:hypothetical protein
MASMLVHPPAGERGRKFGVHPNRLSLGSQGGGIVGLRHIQNLVGSPSEPLVLALQAERSELLCSRFTKGGYGIACPRTVNSVPTSTRA